MTDCYICGHPILEGQRTDRTKVGEKHPKRENIYGPIHANPADHLPTLKNQVFKEAWKRGNAIGFRDESLHERERASKLVENFDVQYEWLEGQGIEYYKDRLKKLADQIRSGE